MTDALGTNQILVYQRAANGALTLVQTIATGGGGAGVQSSPPVDSLGSQGGLRLDAGHHLLFAVNTESKASNAQDCQFGTVTSFVVNSDGQLTFADRVSSGGLFPDSVTVDNSLVYVLNAGGPGENPACGTGPNITGFHVDTDGTMTPLAGSTRSIDPGALNGTGSGVNCAVSGFPVPAFDCGLNPPAFPRSPAQIGFTPDGRRLIVTVKGPNSIYVFPVGVRGRPGIPTITTAPGPALPTYFAFAFDPNGHMLVTEAFGRSTGIPAPVAGAVSSFAIARFGSLIPLSSSVDDQGTAACWIAVEPQNGQFAYVANNLSSFTSSNNSVSLYAVGRFGGLSLVNGNAAGVINGPNDMATAVDGGNSFLYVLDSGDGKVLPFQINLATGALTPLTAAAGLPAGAQGLAAF